VERIKGKGKRKKEKGKRKKENKLIHKKRITHLLFFIRRTPENPVLWTGMKGVPIEIRKNNEMLK
jgi:hypothetical protein